MKILKILTALLLVLSPQIEAHERAPGKEKDHSDEHEQKGREEKGHADEREQKGRDEKGRDEKGRADEHEERNNVGPQKAVLRADEQLGFQLRDGVEDRLGVKTIAVQAAKSLNLPKSGIVYSKEEYQILRKRDGFWKAIDVKILRKGDPLQIESKDLKAGDSIAIDGAGLLKIVEINVFGPAMEGHVH